MTKKMRILLCLVVAFLANASWAAPKMPEPAGAEGKPLDYMIVVTGGELLEGVYPDAHTPFLTRTLRPLGCRCVGSMVVDDSRQDIQQALRFATNRAPLVILTGGLGPTPNDITRETLSEFTGIPLRESEEVLADMEKRFNQRREQLRPNLRRQTLVPARGGYLKNANGTAVGLIFDGGGSVIVALPGPPRELQPMARNELAPYLREHFGVRTFGRSLTLRFVGAGQSLIDQTIKDHVSVAPDVIITSLFEGSRVDFTFSLPGNTPADQARLKSLEESIRAHLAEYIYADDGSSLEEVVARKFLEKGGSLVIAEVGSGGQLAAALNGLEGVSRLLTGSFSAPTEEGLTRLVRMPPTEGDPQIRASALAEAARKSVGAKYALAVGQAVAEKNGGKTVWVAFASADAKTVTQGLSFRETGDIHRTNLMTQILDWLRRSVK